ncbi:MAG: acyl-CoA dehydrogenase [Pseudonocardiales bacterium]|nr:acyl-CoA dehydrogenase [Pseudonocardiales bacterium]
MSACCACGPPPTSQRGSMPRDMAREYRVMSDLRQVGVRVPEMVLFSADDSIVGAPFYVMGYVEGIVVRTDADAQALTDVEAARATDDLVDQLAALHQVDPVAAGLGNLGRAEGFLSRQVNRWQRQWHASGGSETGLPLAELAGLLTEKLPERSAAAIVHGDYRLDNTILRAADPGRVASIIDWEMATLGDPLADLGLLLTYWSPLSSRVTGSGHPITANAGFPAGNHLITRYERTSGRSVDDIDWYIAFGHFKLAVIAQTIQARYAQGLTQGDEFASAG